MAKKNHGQKMPICNERPFFGMNDKKKCLNKSLPAGKKTTRAPKIVCVSHIKRPWNSASFALAIKTLETDVSIASAMRGPDEKPK